MCRSPRVHISSGDVTMEGMMKEKRNDQVREVVVMEKLLTSACIN